MKIALIGYGRMGKAIHQLVDAAGRDEVILTVDAHNREALDAAELAAADVAIEFSHPDAAVANIELALAAGVPIVVGTTGWLGELERISGRVREREGALFWASNFSVGVNVFFAAAKKLAELSADFDAYTATITEVHHEQKLDAPSGTAITLAERVRAGDGRYGVWHLGDVISERPQRHVAPTDAATPHLKPLPITSVRREGVPGTHRLELRSEVDRITLEHEAFSRDGFAGGALAAARWLPGRRGIFTMDDLLGLT